jgi:surfactin synthase thioesterase subunit
VTTTSESKCLWQVQSGSLSGAAVLLLPHSGASAQNFVRWRGAFGPDVELVAAQYPGRASRTSEPLPLSVTEVVDEIAAELAPFEDRPLHVFGHSLGAYVGFELAWRLASSGQPPMTLIVSGAPPLHLERPARPSPRTMSDAAMWEEIDRYGADLTDLRKYPDLAIPFLKVCRGDMAMADEYRYGTKRRRLAVPMLVLGGEDDPIAPASLLPRWAELAAGRCSCYPLTGGHFYFEDDLDAVVTLIARHMDQPSD